MGNEIALLYQRHGGVGLNASTSGDITRYVISLPANRLPLWAAWSPTGWRIPCCASLQGTGRWSWRRRLRTDDSPNGLLYETFTSTAFQAHQYGVPTIGWGRTSSALTPAATEAFFKTYTDQQCDGGHCPGDIKPKEVIALINRRSGKFRLRPHSVAGDGRTATTRRTAGRNRVRRGTGAGHRLPQADHRASGRFRVRRDRRSADRRRHPRDCMGRWCGTSDWLHRCCRIPTIPGCVLPNLFVIAATPLAPYHCRSRGGYL